MSSMKTCCKCKYSWVARSVDPKQCPNCKRYDWKPKEKCALCGQEVKK